MPSSPPDVAPTRAAFVCDCDEWARSACEGLPFFKEMRGGRYCVLHYPDWEKVAAFNEALKRKLDAQDFDFREVYFPDNVDFSNYTFTKPAHFRHATFRITANFNHATFNAEADFRHASFHEADFGSATFGAETNFDSAAFDVGAHFNLATFNAEASFDYTTFHSTVNFRDAIFKDYVRFAGGPATEVFKSDSTLILQFARIENPEFFSFHTVTLRPHWFVNVDARRFEFINVDWRRVSIRDEVESISAVADVSAHRLLSIACRNLAVNAEENHRYEEASRLRYMAMNARRLENVGGLAFWTLGWWYWLASGYGERVWRAFVVLIGVWLLAAALYTQVGFVRWEPRVSSEQEAREAKRDEVGQPLRWQRALTYSLGVMTLQKPEPKPATDAAQAVVMLETILGPVQAALLALALRRKFMR